MLPHNPKHLHISLHSEILGSISRDSAKATVPRQVILTRKPGKELIELEESLLAKMVHDDKTWAEIGLRFPGHPLPLLKENFFRK
jgi:hypothetical protein